MVRWIHPSHGAMGAGIPPVDLVGLVANSPNLRTHFAFAALDVHVYKH